MKGNISAGLLMYRMATSGAPEFFLVHPGGPFFKNRDLGFWTIPKGLSHPGEELIDTAVREFQEETGIIPSPPFADIGTIKQKSGKIVHAWAFAGDWHPDTGIKCNEFLLEWPPRSGKKVAFPEVDRAAWWDYPKAVKAILAEQIPFIDRTLQAISPGKVKNENHPPPA